MAGSVAVRIESYWIGIGRAAVLRAVCTTLILAACAGGAQCGNAQSKSPQSTSEDRQSCQAFVQKFYDWYWNPAADQADQPGFHPLHMPGDVVKLKPPVLSPDLLKLMKRGVRANGGIGALEFDPFLNEPTPRGKFTLGQVFVSGDECRATIPTGHMVAELKKSGESWVFFNFHYSFYYQDGTKQDIPDADLLQMLLL